MMLRANGRRTVPQIFIGEQHVGGSDDIHELDRRGQLDPLLQPRSDARRPHPDALGPDMARNVADAAEMIREAKAQGADFVSTPEMTNILEPDRPRLESLAQPEAEDASVAAFSALAQELGLWLNIGSLALKGEGDKLLNRSLLFAPDGSHRRALRQDPPLRRRPADGRSLARVPRL